MDYEYEDTMKARVYGDSALYYARRFKNNTLLGDAHRNKGWYYHDRSKYNKAIDHYYKSLSYYKKAGFNQGIADAYGNLGNAFIDVGDLQKSLDNQLLSLKTNEAILSKGVQGERLARAEEGRAIAIHNLGAIYSDIEMYDKSFEYAFESLAHELKVKSKVGEAISYNTIAELHKKTDNLDSAEFYFKKALEIYDEHSHPFGLASSLFSYGTLKNSSLSKDEKVNMIKRSLDIRRRQIDADGEARALVDISLFFFDELSKDSLSNMLERAYFLIEKENLESIRQDYFRVYSKYNSKIGKYSSAYFALENYLELRAVSDEKRRAHDLIAGSIKHQLQSQYYNDSLQQQNNFANERAEHQEEISKIQNIVYLSVIGFIILIASLFFYINKNRRRKRMNNLLTEKNSLIQEQKAIVDERNQSISDSINYARRLQAAILPTSEQINEYLPKSFLFFRPKDVVSGDFHWFSQKDDMSFLAVADCTGHGVPGAMVSVVCSNALNRAVNEFQLREPNEILDKTRDLVIETFALSGENVADGMDISLVRINQETKKIIFAGAHNSLWLVRDNDKLSPEATKNARILESQNQTLLEFKGDKQPIGLFANMSSFNQIEIDIESNDIIYLFSDGYADQFGGEKGKKLKYVPFKRVLLDNSMLSMEKQLERLVKSFDSWKGGYDQVDDVCVVGVRIG
jgi:serine phosphatase RsbU (regulator of sigma subunit)